MTPPGLHHIRVETNPSYTLHVGEGTVDALAGWLPDHAPGRRCVLVTDSNVAGLYGSTVSSALSAGGVDAELVVVPAGESAKTRATKEHVEDSLAQAGFGRDSIIVSLGGGVVTDLAGFVAATWMRGIPHVPVPTTLLGMVDAAIGGKTGVDHPAGKNLIGAFHQPAAVFIDVEFLRTLAGREFSCGIAEVIKTSIVGDASLFDDLEKWGDAIQSRDPAAMEELVLRACRVKADVVAADATEGDLRKILNFGHTVGHALENLTRYALSHGEAVSIGMVAEARLAVVMGLLSRQACDRIEALLNIRTLPVRLPVTDRRIEPAEVIEAARMDKKARGSRVVCALPSSIGEMSRGPAGYGIDVDEQELLKVLEDLQQSNEAT